MLRNYFKTAIRNILRYKGFALINIASLTIGILGCLVIGLFVWDEKQYDHWIAEGDQVYRIYEERTDNTAVTHAACVPPVFASFLNRQYPEVDTTARILMADDKFLMESGEKRLYENKGWYVDASFFEVFPLSFIKGNAATALTQPSTIVLTKELSERYFGQEDPVGRTLKIDKTDFTVSGVLADLPKRFHLEFRFLMPLSAAGINPDRMDNWTWHQFYTYVKLKPGADVQSLQDKFQAHIKKEIFPELTAGSTFLPFFQPLKDIHLKSADFIYDNAIRGNESYVRALTIIALFVLIIACFNFINLATARSFRRAKEIGVRKVVAANRKQLIFQFILETVLLSVFSVVLATAFTYFFIPLLNEFTGKSIEFNPFSNPVLGLLLVAAGICIGMLAGIYPALILSGFQPMHVLKSLKLPGKGLSSSWLRQALVVVQFALSSLLIVSAMIVYRQTSFLNDKDLGFSKEQVMTFKVQGDLEKKLEALKSELKQSSNIVSVTSGYGLPGDRYAGETITMPGKNGNTDHSANVFIGDHDYVKTLGLRIIAGRDFSREMTTDVEEAFLINETAAKEWGFEKPEMAIGQRINWDKWIPDSLHPVKEGKVIGVVRDFHYKSLHEKITASVIQIYPPVVYKVAVKLKTADMENTLAYIRETYNKFSPDYPLDYEFMDEGYGQMYKSEEKLSTLLWIFTVMAIVVGCMGLFALAAFSAELRTKEIGIRKVLGASMLSIMGLLSKSFLGLVLLASAIALPLAWWAMNKWLSDFPYRVDISWWVFGFAVFCALFIALITISFQSIRAARANPVMSLRSE